jgi:hypothetical protein
MGLSSPAKKVRRGGRPGSGLQLKTKGILQLNTSRM